MTRSSARPRRRVPPADIPVRNSILAALLASEYERLLPKLEHVTLKGGDLFIGRIRRSSTSTSPKKR